ncbi:hypothetical protein MPNT_10093 [Candidatus Methylacidithermus pantelleriae]|uniref:Uncharacterized protein n=1 Tax=Candidatus Methylacidithermus pantelleriae TaxID=2744239 RepID=A0A8J2BQG2_9BACT|nr:hypothetical protein MPNT_10093 [Candidatus Methylacidithermus pantelleriae]
MVRESPFFLVASGTLSEVRGQSRQGLGGGGPLTLAPRQWDPVVKGIFFYSLAFNRK